MTTDKEKINEVLDIINDYGGIDGSHHKAWCLDQTVRILTGDKYDAWVAKCKTGDTGPEDYDYDVGIAP